MISAQNKALQESQPIYPQPNPVYRSLLLGGLALLFISASPLPKFEVHRTSWGTFYTRKTPGSFVLSAPHGGFDRFTLPLAKSLCEQMNWNCLLAQGFRSKKHRLNVNRPTEGLARETPERFTPKAKNIYQAYLGHLKRLKPLAQISLYVELHGNQRNLSQRALEIAQVGWSSVELRALKHQLNQNLKKVGFRPDQLQAKVEGLDKLHFYSHMSKQTGVHGVLPKTLAIEIPKWVRYSSRHRSKLQHALKLTFEQWDD